MTNEMPNDGRIGKEIDWSLVIPSITRPVWEPPALEILDRFEEFVKMNGASDSLNIDNEWLRSLFPDVGQRSKYIDVVCEGVALARYRQWATETQTTAIETGNQQKAEFYQSLAAALGHDERAVLVEHNMIWLKRSYNHGAETVETSTGEEEPVSGNIKKQKSDSDKEKDNDRGDEDASDAGSTTSYATAADDHLDL